MTARPPATSAIEIGTELILDPPNARLSRTRALGKPTRRGEIQFAERSLGRVSLEQAESPSRARAYGSRPLSGDQKLLIHRRARVSPERCRDTVGSVTDEYVLEVAGRAIALTSPDKVF